MSETELPRAELNYQTPNEAGALSNVIGYIAIKLFGLYMLFQAALILPWALFIIVGYWIRGGPSASPTYYNTEITTAYGQLLGIGIYSGLAILCLYNAQSWSNRLLKPVGAEIETKLSNQWLLLGAMFIGLQMLLMNLPYFSVDLVLAIEYIRKSNSGGLSGTSLANYISFYSFLREGLSIVLGGFVLFRPSWIVGKINQYAALPGKDEG